MEGENVVSSSSLQSDTEELDEISLIEAEINDQSTESESDGGEKFGGDKNETIRQYVVYVQNDGVISLDKSGIIPEGEFLQLCCVELQKRICMHMKGLMGVG